MADSRNSDPQVPPVRAARPFVRPGSGGARSAISAAEIRPARLTRPPFRVQSWSPPVSAPIEAAAAASIEPAAPAPIEAAAPAPIGHSAPAPDAPMKTDPLVHPVVTHTVAVPIRGLIAETSSATADTDAAHAGDLEMIERGTPDARVGTPTDASDVLLAEASRIAPTPEAAEQPVDHAADLDDDGTSAMAAFDRHADAVDHAVSSAASVSEDALDDDVEETAATWDATLATSDAGFDLDDMAATWETATPTADAGADVEDAMAAWAALSLELESGDATESHRLPPALAGSVDADDADEWDTPWMAGLLAGGVASPSEPAAHDAYADTPDRASGHVAADVFERLAHRIRGGEIAVPDRMAASGDAAILAAVLSSLLLGRTTD